VGLCTVDGSKSREALCSCFYIGVDIVKVKIGDKIYDSNNEPIMVITTEEERKHISNMNGSSYCSYPDDAKYTYEAITKWMQEGAE